jgi:hypothetical protein
MTVNTKRVVGSERERWVGSPPIRTGWPQVDRFFVVLNDQAACASTMSWLFRTLEGAKATLGERAGSIWKNGRGAATGREKVYEQR